MAATIADLGVRVLRRLGVAVVPASLRPEITAFSVVSGPVIALRALQWLGVVAAEETPLPADQALADAKVAAVHDALLARAIASWTFAAIPSAVAEDYVMLTAMQLAPGFGKTADPAQRPMLEERVRQVTMIARAPALAEQKVMAVHASLDARGKTRWSVLDLPSYVEEPYVVLAANMLAPEFGLPVDQAAAAMAMRELTQAISLPSSGDRVVAEYF